MYITRRMADGARGCPARGSLACVSKYKPQIASRDILVRPGKLSQGLFRSSMDSRRASVQPPGKAMLQSKVENPAVHIFLHRDFWAKADCAWTTISSWTIRRLFCIKLPQKTCLSLTSATNVTRCRLPSSINGVAHFTSGQKQHHYCRQGWSSNLYGCYAIAQGWTIVDCLAIILNIHKYQYCDSRKWPTSARKSWQISQLCRVDGFFLI